MPHTIIEQLLSQASGKHRVHAGDIVVADIGLTVLLDTQFTAGQIHEPEQLHDPGRVAIVLDHAVPAPGIREARGASQARAFASRHGIDRFYDVGRHGIVHQVIAENALVVPGETLACSDSHTCAAGALNVAARGLGSPEIVQILCTGKTWYQVPPTILYRLNNEKPPYIGGKDIFLHIAGLFGAATNFAIEFAGNGLYSIPMHDRRTIATQGAEVGADFTVFPADELCTSYVMSRCNRQFEPAPAHPNAGYTDIRDVDLHSIEPMVGLPGSITENCVPARLLKDVKLNQCFIGSCANGQIEDIEIAANILTGREVAPETRLIVTPASQAVYIEASRRGWLTTLAESGAVVTNPTCGACFGYHMGVLGPNEVCLTSSTRNFRGRMGSPDAEIYMASTATVAASALTGHITDPREWAAKSHD
jgi:3-isopropylmalate/(R)-2-methylmalate dehydratase large subunit